MTTATIDKPKRHISAVTAEYRAFWQPLFDHMGLASPHFGAKLCYQSRDFSNDGSRVPGVRFFPSELNNGVDYYTELFDWDQNRYDPANRTLYRLKNDPEWQSKPDKYIEIASDKLPTSTYAVRLSDFEIINITNATALTPELKKPVTAEKAPHLFSEVDLDLESQMTEMFSDKEDNHYSSMTIRDLYCMLQNVPLSNKKWLNQLITSGKQWQQLP
jgi:hypothetical protein